MNQYQVLQFPVFKVTENGTDEPLSTQINRWLTEHPGWHIYGLWNIDYLEPIGKISPWVLIQFRKE